MAMTDTVADMLTRIRNACGAGHKWVDVPRSGLKAEIARILLDERFVAQVDETTLAGYPALRLQLRYDREGRPVIRGIDRISKPGCRRYAGVGELPRVLDGLGIAVLSTSKGVMTDQDCRRAGVGGEVLCQVW